MNERALSSQCLECGDSAKHQHPDYSDDRLCDDCYMVDAEERVEAALDHLLDVEEATSLKSLEYDDLLEALR